MFTYNTFETPFTLKRVYPKIYFLIWNEMFLTILDMKNTKCKKIFQNCTKASGKLISVSVKRRKDNNKQRKWIFV